MDHPVQRSNISRIHPPHSGLLDPAGGGRGGYRGHFLAARVAAARREADRRRAAEPAGDAAGDGGVGGGRERSRTVGYSGKSELNLANCKG